MIWERRKQRSRLIFISMTKKCETVPSTIKSVISAQPNTLKQCTLIGENLCVSRRNQGSCLLLFLGVLLEKWQKRMFISTLALSFPLSKLFIQDKGYIAQFHGWMGPVALGIILVHVVVGYGRMKKNNNFNYFVVWTGVEDCPLKATEK